MPDLKTDTLPLLPLTSGVVLPQMIVTLALETDEARAAADAALATGNGEAGDGLLLLVPSVNGRYATVGTVAKIENAGELPSGDGGQDHQRYVGHGAGYAEGRLRTPADELRIPLIRSHRRRAPGSIPGLAGRVPSPSPG